MRVLDVGCGVGGPALEIVRFSDATIVGLNNNDFQLGRARGYTKKAGLDDRVTYVKGDFMKLSEQFGENSFDAGTSRFRSIITPVSQCYVTSLRHRGDCTRTIMGRCLWRDL